MKTDTGHVLFVNGHDAITGAYAEALGRPTSNGIHHVDRVAHDVELDADPFEVAFQGFVHLLQVLLRDIDGMRIQFLEHAHDGRIHELLVVHIIHVHAVDVVEQGSDLSAGEWIVVLSSAKKWKR